MSLKDTNVWIVINEQDLTLLKKYDPETYSMVTATFETEQQADQFASERLDLWTCFNVLFTHHVFSHKANN